MCVHISTTLSTREDHIFNTLPVCLVVSSLSIIKNCTSAIEFLIMPY